MLSRTLFWIYINGLLNEIEKCIESMVTQGPFSPTDYYRDTEIMHEFLNFTIGKDFIMTSISEEDRDVLRFLSVNDIDKGALNARVEIFQSGVWCCPKLLFAECNFTAPFESAVHVSS